MMDLGPDDVKRRKIWQYCWWPFFVCWKAIILLWGLVATGHGKGKATQTFYLWKCKKNGSYFTGDHYLSVEKRSYCSGAGGRPWSKGKATQTFYLWIIQTAFELSKGQTTTLEAVQKNKSNIIFAARSQEKTKRSSKLGKGIFLLKVGTEN